MQGEVLTRELLNKLFNGPIKRDRSEWVHISGNPCSQCHGTGMWSRLEQSNLVPQGKVLRWYHCQCQEEAKNRGRGAH